MSHTTLEKRKIDSLKNHRLNAKVFGQIGPGEADCDFVDSVKQHGVLQPLLISDNGTIIAGHRRRQAAAKAGLKEVPVVVRRDLADQLAIDMAWFETNRNREMTVEQKARWIQARVDVLAEDAAKRKAATQFSNGESQTGTHRESGENKAKSDNAKKSLRTAAAEAGISHGKAAEALKVVEAIDEAIESGDTETAEELREALNNESVAAATRKVKAIRADADMPPCQVDEDGNEVPANLLAVFEARVEFRTLSRKLRDIGGKLAALKKTTAGRHLDEAPQLAEELAQYVDDAMPARVVGRGWEPAKTDG